MNNNLLIEFFGKRSTLQAIFFIICLLAVIPHSRFFVRDANAIYGRQTLLYSLVGPGNQDFSLEELSVDYTAVATETSPGWREGAVSSVAPGTVGVEREAEAQEMVGTSLGGSALAKPSILPGSVLPTSGESATGRTELVYYEVNPGDTIGQIAEKFKISVETILWANNLSIRSYIRPGDKLQILPVSGLVYKVKKGDTVSKIARTYDVTAEEIIKFNRLQKDGGDIVVGEDLTIPGGEKPQPVYSYTVPSNQSFRNVAAPAPSVNAPAGSGYLWPTAARKITQYFGWRHTGLDVAGPVGTPIYAARSGKVIKAQGGYNGGYGNMVTIQHPNGTKTLYAHMSSISVAVGQTVSRGNTIGNVGSTGRSTGPHLHFEIRRGGELLDPLQFLR